MTHGDDYGLRIPPLVAPVQVIIVPIVRNEADMEVIHIYSNELQKQLSRKKLNGKNIRVSIDKREINGGEKKWYHIKRGVPVRVEIGIKELQQKMISYCCRNNISLIEKISAEHFIKNISKILKGIQKEMLNTAKLKMSENTKTVTTLEEFKKTFKQKDKISPFVMAPFVDNETVEKAIAELGVTVRCIPFEQTDVESACLFSGEPTRIWALYAKSY